MFMHRLQIVAWKGKKRGLAVQKTKIYYRKTPFLLPDTKIQKKVDLVLADEGGVLEILISGGSKTPRNWIKLPFSAILFVSG